MSSKMYGGALRSTALRGVWANIVQLERGITSVLVPWNTCSIYMVTILGVTCVSICPMRFLLPVSCRDRGDGGVFRAEARLVVERACLRRRAGCPASSAPFAPAVRLCRRLTRTVQWSSCFNARPSWLRRSAVPHVRKSKLVDERLRAYADYLVADPAALRGAWRQRPGRPDAKLHVDLGCGKGFGSPASRARCG